MAAPLRRIVGDDADLPHGWTVDEDNWGVRPERTADHARREANHQAAIASFLEDGRLFVMRADVAAYFDGKGA